MGYTIFIDLLESGAKKNMSRENNPKKPDWIPEGAGREFASRVMEGVDGGHDGIGTYSKSQTRSSHKKRPSLTIDEYAEGVLSGDRAVLGRAITLVESNSIEHIEQAQELLKRLLPHTGNSIRIGITGVPGVGKSTFIESLGNYLLEKGKKPAVLAIDPSSSKTGGSILGDKTRMECLGRDSRCFIRPSPSGGTLGGVARKSRETMLVCEAAGFNVILIETVGVGQSEITVRSMVDFFLLLMLAGAGDELQGIKKGIMEIADALCINKADGDNKKKAEVARSEFERALHYLQPATQGWYTHAYSCSSITGDGIDSIWNVIESFERQTKKSGVFESRRKSQTLDWVHAMVNEHLLKLFYRHPDVAGFLPEIEKAVLDGSLPPTSAVTELFRKFNGSI